MLDGRIDSQGTIQDLRTQGILADLTATADVELKEDAIPVGSDDKTIDESAPKDPIGEAKKPAKLIEDEKREIGAVKWHIYGTYIVRQHCTDKITYLILFTESNVGDDVVIFRVINHLPSDRTGHGFSLAL